MDRNIWAAVLHPRSWWRCCSCSWWWWWVDGYAGNAADLPWRGSFVTATALLGDTSLATCSVCSSSRFWVHTSAVCFFPQWLLLLIYADTHRGDHNNSFEHKQEKEEGRISALIRRGAQIEKKQQLQFPACARNLFFRPLFLSLLKPKE